MKKHFFEQYNNESKKDSQGRETIILGHRSFAGAIVSFLEQLIHLLLYLCIMALASVGLTTFANKALRALFFEMIQKLL